MRRPAAIRAGLAAAVLATCLASCGSSTVGARAGNRSAALGPGARAACPKPGRLVVTRRVALSRGIGPVAVGGGAVWVANPATGDVADVSGSSVRTVRLGGAPISLAFAYGKLWVAERDAGLVVTLDPGSLKLLSRAGVPVPVRVVAGPIGTWALSLDAASLFEFYPSTGRYVLRIYAPVADPADMVPAGSELWVLGAGEHGLSPVSVHQLRALRAGIIRPGQPLAGLSSAGETIWVAEPASHTLLRVDARTVAVRQFPAPGGIAPTATAPGACGLWVADAAGTLALMDPETGAPLASPLHLGAPVAALAAGTETTSAQPDVVWVTDPVHGALASVALVAAR